MTENSQVAIIENSLEVLKTGPKILTDNQSRKDKALTVGRNILSAIESNGMSPEIDDRAMKYLANISTANKEMKESRAAVTQIMDQLKKMYTEVENELDTKKPGTIPAQIQSHRDQYAKDIAAEQERKRKEAERAAAKAKEAIEIKSQAEVTLSGIANDLLLSAKTRMNTAFNAITLATYQEKETNLRAYIPKIDITCPSKLSVVISLHSVDETKALIEGVYEEKAGVLITSVNDQLSKFRDELIEKLPSKKAELVEAKRLADEAAAAAEAARIAEEQRQAEIAKASAAQKKKLEEEARIAREQEELKQAELKKQQAAADAERKRREEEESARMAAEAEEARKKAEQEAEIKKQGDQTMVMFEQEAAIADTTPKPETREGYEITVLHPVGFTQIFALWFENEGKNLPVDKIGNTKLDQMKSWAEKQVHKNGTRIDSKFIKYEATYKAINKKAK